MSAGRPQPPSGATPRHLRARLEDGEAVVGSWLSLASCGAAEVLARAGFDFLVVDLEHSTTSLESTEALLRTIEGCGSTPLVRLSSLDAVQIKRVLDAGAQGIVIPQVRSCADLDAAAAAMHYPPRGVRGVGLSRAQGYGASFDAYRLAFAQSAMLVAQIENTEAVAHIDALVEHPDLSACLIGPYDLSASLGLIGQLEHPRVLEAVERVVSACRIAGIPAGFHQVAPDPAALRRLLDAGHRFIAYGVDFTFLDAGARAGLAAR